MLVGKGADIDAETVTRHYLGIRDSIYKHVEYLYLGAVRYRGSVMTRWEIEQFLRSMHI